MENLRIEKTRSTPEVFFDSATGILTLCGESYPENSFEFYQPILAWVSEFLATHEGPTIFNIELSYLNTGSTKCMMDLLDLFEDAFKTGRKITVNWHCDPENDRAMEAAEEFQEEVTVPFSIVSIGEDS
jgi:hypothetical protein